ncbi:MAG: Lon protease-like protein [Alphaproteobacteria bacterium]
MLPILPLKTVLVPDMPLTVHLEDERYQALIKRCTEHDGELAVVFCSDYTNEAASLGRMGCKASIVKCETMIDGTMEVELMGLHRFAFSETLPKLNIHYAADVQYVFDTQDITDADPLLDSVFEIYQQYMNALHNFDVQMMPEICLTNLKATDSLRLLNSIALAPEKRQEGLEILSARERFVFILSCLRLELDMLRFVTSMESAMPSFASTLN